MKELVCDLINYAENLTDFCDDFWNNKIEQDIIHFITREKIIDKRQLKVIINHPYEGNALIINNQYIFYYIHKLCRFLDISPKQFSIRTGNWQIFKQYYYWHQDHCAGEPLIKLEAHFLLSKIYAPKLFDIPNKDRVIPKINYEPVFTEPQDKDLAFNCLNKQPNRHRMTMYQELSEKQLMHRGIVSFNKAGDTTLTGSLPRYLQNQLPISYDVDLNEHQTVMSFGDIEFTRAIELSAETSIYNNFADIYRKTHFTVVTETLLGNMNNIFNDCSSRTPHYNGCVALMEYDRTVNRMICPVCQSQKVPVPDWVKYYHVGFITEKTFRQFLNAHPMIWVAPPFTIKMLKHLGFKTFDSVWKEDYDNIIDPSKRIARIIQIITDLCNKDHAEWRVINRKLKPILEHNQQLMLNLSEVPVLTWDNLPDFIIKDPVTDLFNSYLDPEQGINAVADTYYAGDKEKAKKILGLIK